MNPEEELKNPILMKSRAFLSNRKNSNELTDILECFEVDKVTPAHILAFEMILVDLLKRDQLSLDGLNEGEPEHKYHKWLRDCYFRGRGSLRFILSHKSSDAETRIQALDTGLKLYVAEARLKPNGEGGCDENRAPGHRKRSTQDSSCVQDPMSASKTFLYLYESIENLVTSLVSVDGFKSKLNEYTSSYPYLVVHIWDALACLSRQVKKPQPMTWRNVLGVIDSFPKDKTTPLQLIPDVKRAGGVKASGEEQEKEKERAKWRKELSADARQVWSWCMEHRSCDPSPSALKALLVALLEHFLPLLHEPTFLADFLVSSLNVGGATSLLALQGIFVLVQKHNMDYPNIYGKLYSMLKAEIFTTKYKARFFYLLDLFLSSTYLPEQLVAAFVKRLSRLALEAPPEDILILLPFIGNLVIRHPGLKRLADRQSGLHEGVTADPYVMDEPNPNESRALESSLWEIKTLQSHLLPSVASAATFINRPMPTVEWDLASKLELTADQMFERERKKKKLKADATTTITFERPRSMDVPRCLALNNMWCI